jgi:hypothetical protein
MIASATWKKLKSNGKYVIKIVKFAKTWKPWKLKDVLGL